MAQKAADPGKVAVEVLTEKPATSNEVVPAVVFTNPEVAEVGLGKLR